MKKSFIVTVDTEPDNQWDINGDPTTVNAKYIERFQRLCNKYHFKPVYLTDYIMAKDNFFIGEMKAFLKDGICEVGMHLHAWDTPPFHDMDASTIGRPYLIEYPVEVMKQKIDAITGLLEDTFQQKMVSHRAGRWATNPYYFELLEKYGYKVDCSVTPHINWQTTVGGKTDSKGTDYSCCPEDAHIIPNTHILEVPMTIKSVSRSIAMQYGRRTLRSLAKYVLKGDTYWCRPALHTEAQLLYLVEQCKERSYIEMMIHSSELMPGGSPYFTNEEEIDHLYALLDSLFSCVSDTHMGATLMDYYEEYVGERL